MPQNQWKCPGCQQVFIVPSDLVIASCRKCAAKKKPPAIPPSGIRLSDRDCQRLKFYERWDVLAFFIVALMAVPLFILWNALSANTAEPIAQAKAQEIPPAEANPVLPEIEPIKIPLEAKDDKVSEPPIQPVGEPVVEKEEEKKEAPIPIETPKSIPIRKKANHEQEMVRAWLKENLDSGSWEELRWWAPMNIKFEARERRICGLKLRTTNKFGANVVDEIVFDLGNNSVRELKTGSWADDQSRFDPDGLNWTAWEYLTGSNPKPDPLDHNGINMFKAIFEGNRDAREQKEFPDQRKKGQPPKKKK